MTTSEAQCLSIEDTAKRLAISVPTLYKLLNIKGDKKKLKSIELGGRRVIQEAEILRFLSEGGKGDLYD